MGEANGPVLVLDHVCVDCRFERIRLNARPLQERFRRCAQRRGELERLAGGCRKTGKPRAHELFEQLGDRQRLQRVDVCAEHPGELQREEGVSARGLVDAEQRLAREGPAEPFVQEPMKRTDAERPDRTRWTLSASSARSSSDGGAPSTVRRARSTSTA